MAEIFYEILKEWSAETIEAAFQQHMKSSKWMPSPAEIETLCSPASQSLEYERQKKQPALPMPDHLPESVRKENLKRIRGLMSPERQVVYINEKYKPEDPKPDDDVEIVYVS